MQCIKKIVKNPIDSLNLNFNKDSFAPSMITFVNMSKRQDTNHARKDLNNI